MFIIEGGFVFLVVLLSLLSGVGSFLQGKREGRLTNALDLLSEVVLALIVGLIVAYVGEANNIERGYTCALVLVLSNNGSDTLNSLRKMTFNRLSQVFNLGGKGK